MDYENIAPDIEYFIWRKCDAKWEIIEMEMNYWDISYVLKGSGLYKINGKDIVVSQGDLMCVPTGSVRSASYLPENPMEVVSANFNLFAVGTSDDLTIPLPLVCRIGYRADIIKLYQDLNAEWLRRSPGYQLRSRAIFMLILARYYELICYRNDSEAIDPRIRRMMRYIAEHYAERLDAVSMSELCNLNPLYFGTLFKKETGQSFRQYLMDIRLNHAENMLRSGEYSVTQVADACGFSDVTYFSRSYKKAKGTQPSVVGSGEVI